MKPELLAPVGDWTMLEAAIQGGADAIYFGIKGLNMRARANNFEISDMKKIAERCHKNKIKAYLTLNVIAFDDEMNKIRNVLEAAKRAGIDAVICWDMGVLKEARKLGMEVHLSTQASVSNFESLKFYHDQGVKRFVLARELNLDQIKEIINRIKKEKLNAEIEVFVHGAMCVSLSGRCFMSQFIFGKSANRGECLQPCRREYIIKDIDNEYELKIGNNYILSPKDICTLGFLEKLIEAEINCFKIEGRNRSPEYVKTVTKAYREVIDAYGKKDFEFIKKKNLELLKTVYNRGFSSGFYFGKPLNEWTNSSGNKATEKKEYIGKIVKFYDKISVAEVLLEAGDIKLGDKIMIQGNSTGSIEQIVDNIEINKSKIERAEKGKLIALKTDQKIQKNDKVYKIIKT